MTCITSKRHFAKFYLAIFGFVFFFLVMALIICTIQKEEVTTVGEVITAIVGAVLVFMAFYTVVRYYQYAPIIEVDDTSITFNHSEKYFWKDLEHIELTGKKPFKFMGETKEATTLKFRGRQERYFFDDMYTNSHEIKFFIKQVVVDKQPYSDQKDFNADRSTAASESFVYFNGYQLLCIDGITFWFFLTPLLLVLAKLIMIVNIGGVIGAIIFTAIWTLIFARRLYYFGLSADYFVVKMNNLFWYRKVYRLSDIHEIVFEQHGKMPVSLRVITIDFQSNLFPADTLWSKKWMQLKGDLEKKNIKVRNEAVSYTPFEFKLFN